MTTRTRRVGDTTTKIVGASCWHNGRSLITFTGRKWLTALSQDGEHVKIDPDGLYRVELLRVDHTSVGGVGRKTGVKDV